MKPIVSRGLDQARNQFARLMDEAARGNSTLITKYGRPYAAVVSADALEGGEEADFLALGGTGKGYGANP